MGAEFINIELEVRSSFDLTELSDALSNYVGINYCGIDEPGKDEYLLSGSYLDNSCDDKDGSLPEDVAANICEKIENLPQSVRQLWDMSSDRIFDVGLEANLDRKVIVNLFSPEILERMAALGVRLAVSVYALDLEQKLSKIKQNSNRH